MAVKGSKYKPPKKVKPLTKAIPPFKQYQTNESGSADSLSKTAGGSRKNAPAIRGIKGILQNYKATIPKPTGGNPAPTRRISPNRITRLKQERATEASQATNYAYRNAPNAGRHALSQAGRTTQQNKARPIIISPRQKAPPKTPGGYRKVQASPVNADDYRKDYNTWAAVQDRNKKVSDSRERARIKSARRKKYG